MLDLDWNIDKDYHRDYRIPVESVTGVVDAGTKPATSFRFKTIGLLPVDATRIVNGYAFSKVGDPCSPVTREPFCDTLRIHGLFAAVPAVASYTVEIFRTNACGAAIAGELWKSIGDRSPTLNGTTPHEFGNPETSHCQAADTATSTSSLR